MADPIDRLRVALSGRYAIARELGRGGMATVYLAHDLKHERKVAIKVLRPELAAAIGPERFLREIKVTAQLNHPHILPLLDSGEADGFLYYVMPYVEGESLRDRLNREKQLPIEDAIEIAREVADALDYAHQHDVVHRDVKPENILLQGHHAVVADFGIARAISVAGGERLTTTGVAVGTPEYMSPEQASGRGELDGRSDVYALGCVLHEMLAGQPPFTGPTVESVVHQHLAAEAPRITAIRSAVPQSLEVVLQRALAKSAADRFTSAAFFGEALRDASRTRTGRPSAVRSWQVGAGVVAVGVLALVAWATGLLRGGADGATDPPRALTIVADVEGTAEQGVRTAIRELVRTALDQSGILVAVSQEDLRRGLQLAGRPETTTVGPELARELAVRGSIRTVVAPRVDRLGQRYALTVRVLDAEGGEPIATEAGSADTDDALVTAVERTMRDVRSRLGERPGDIQRNRPLVQVATPSFDAYRHYIEATVFAGRGDRAGAVQLLRRALGLDPDFAAAWLSLSGQQGEQGKRDSANASLLEAQRRPHRLTDRQRFQLEALLAELDRDLPRALRARYLIVDRDPLNPGALNTLAGTLTELGRWEEALEVFDRGMTVSPFGPPQLLIGNRGRILVSLGRLAEAEANTQMLEGELRAQADVRLALVKGEWARAESMGVALERDPTANAFRRVRAAVTVAGTHAARGQIRAAQRALERARELAIGDVNVVYTSWVLRTELTLGSASGDGKTPRPLPALTDTLTAAQWAAATGDTSRARRLLAALRASDGPTTDLGVRRHQVESTIAAVRGDWPRVIELLAPVAKVGVPLAGGDQAVRWLVAEAHERMGRPDSAAAYFDLVTSYTRLGILNHLTYGIAYAFAHQRLVLLYSQMGRLEDARRHWRIFSETFTNPDPEVAHLLDEAREALLKAERERG